MLYGSSCRYAEAVVTFVDEEALPVHWDGEQNQSSFASCCGEAFWDNSTHPSTQQMYHFLLMALVNTPPQVNGAPIVLQNLQLGVVVL
jgi:hypothetical protein